MAAKVRVYVPTHLRETTGGEPYIAIEADTLAALLDAIARTHPALASRLALSAGTVGRHVSVFVNNEAIAFDSRPDWPLVEGDEVAMIPALAGGEEC